jgi:putative transposase
VDVLDDLLSKATLVPSALKPDNRIEHDHRGIKRRIQSMLGFKSPKSAAIILSGIEMIHIMRKRQAEYDYIPSTSIAEQFEVLAA